MYRTLAVGKEGPKDGTRGLTLLEVMVAGIVFVVGIIGLMSAISSSMIVDSVAQENNLALNGAREVIERVKSEGFAALEARATLGPSYLSANLEPDTDPEAEPETPTATTSLGNQHRGLVHHRHRATRGTSADETADTAAAGVPGAETSSESQETETETETLTPNWYGAVSDAPQDSIQIDENGGFSILGLAPWDDDLDGKVGSVTVTRVADDRVEITVTVRWKGCRGNTEKVLRCRIPDWRRFDAK